MTSGMAGLQHSPSGETPDGTHPGPVAQDRHRRGARPATTKLTEAQVIQIRERYASGEPTDLIAADFGVTPQNVSTIASGRSWKNAGGPITSRRTTSPGTRRWREGGRQLEATRRSNGTLTAPQVAEIRARYAAGQTQVSLAAKFGVTQSAISNLITGRSWRGVADPLASSASVPEPAGNETRLSARS